MVKKEYGVGTVETEKRFENLMSEVSVKLKMTDLSDVTKAMFGLFILFVLFLVYGIWTKANGEQIGMTTFILIVLVGFILISLKIDGHISASDADRTAKEVDLMAKGRAQLEARFQAVDPE